MMKKSINSSVRAGLAMLVLALSGSVHAQNNVENMTLSYVFSSGGDFIPTALSRVTIGSDPLLAFCIDPNVSIDYSVDYTAKTPIFTSKSVQYLYSNYYGDVKIDQTDAQAAYNNSFQVALWELYNDNPGGTTASLSGGSLKFLLPGDIASGDLELANSMVVNSLYAVEHNTAMTNAYSFYSLTTGGGAAESQTLLSASMTSAVPEADTWAMLVAGLGVLGFMRRRKAG